MSGELRGVENMSSNINNAIDEILRKIKIRLKRNKKLAKQILNKRISEIDIYLLFLHENDTISISYYVQFMKLKKIYGDIVWIKK